MTKKITEKLDFIGFINRIYRIIQVMKNNDIVQVEYDGYVTKIVRKNHDWEVNDVTVVSSSLYRVGKVVALSAYYKISTYRALDVMKGVYSLEDIL